MPLKILLLALVSASCLSGCKHKESQRAVLDLPPAMEASLRQKPVHLEPGSRLESFVGRRVELSGIVSEARVPHLQGVDLWDFEQFRGRPLYVSGELQRTEVSSNGVGAIRTRDSGTDGFIAPVDRGTGTFYRFHYLVWGYSR